jgi:hypothetical protein
VGRYTFRLDVGLTADPDFGSVVYQASGGQLIWLDVDASGDSVFLGSMQQQGSLTALPAAQANQSKGKE